MSLIGKTHVKNTSYRRMAKIFLFTMSALYGVSALINFIADPFWAFQQSNIFNRVQLPFNEREQKTNYLTYHGRSFDSILIGNSRTTLINQNDFRNMKTFNYAVSAIAPSEFPGYIAYALNRSGGRVNTVYISCSFASANCRIEQGVPKPPSYYIGMAMEPLHRLKMLTNLNLIPYSYRVIKENITQPKSGIHYDRNNIASMIPFERTEQERIFRKDLDNYLNLYSNAFVYDSKHFSHNMLEIIKSNPELKFIAFSPPVTSEMHCLIKKTGLEKQYEQ